MIYPAKSERCSEITITIATPGIKVKIRINSWGFFNDYGYFLFPTFAFTVITVSEGV
jgi:hypothetical protein